MDTPHRRRLQGEALSPNIPFDHNDYLGLSKNPVILDAIRDGVSEYGFGAKGSRLLGGDHPLFHRLERDLASWLGKPSSLVFNSGYQMNVGLLPALLDKGDVIFADKLVHASLIDGALASNATLFRFRHNDMNHLNALLETHRSSFRSALIITEGLFSMDGDTANLEELVTIKGHYDATLLVDEAHSIGCVGDEGRGVASLCGCLPDIDILTGTFGKAFGGAGAFVAGDNDLKERLINTCRSFIYSTAMPLPVVSGNIASLSVIRDGAVYRDELMARVHSFRAAFKDIPIEILGDHHIVPIVIGGVPEVMSLSESLAVRGYNVPGIRPPTVPKGRARLRVSLSVSHPLEKVVELSSEIKRLAPKT